MKKKITLKTRPEIGKFYHFWDDGKTSPSRCVGREEAPSPIPVEFLTKEWQANEDDMFKWVYNTDDYPNITVDDMYICEVLGNIHDHPSLIEEGGETQQKI